MDKKPYKIYSRQTRFGKSFVIAKTTKKEAIEYIDGSKNSIFPETRDNTLFYRYEPNFK